jgi:hypothetical protein
MSKKSVEKILNKKIFLTLAGKIANYLFN